MKTKYRDVIIILVISTIAIFGYFMFKKAFSNQKHDRALIKYNGELVASVDFKERKVTKEVEDSYPIIDLENNIIIILGNKLEDGKRYEVHIKYDFDKRSMQIVRETSPKKYCSKEGEKTSGSITCLPNGVTITFDDYEDDLDGII